MKFVDWLREEQGYNVYNDYDIMEQLSADEADYLWNYWDAQYYEEGE